MNTYFQQAGLRASVDMQSKSIAIRVLLLVLCCALGYLLGGCGDNQTPVPAPQPKPEVVVDDALPEVCNPNDKNNVTAEVVALEQIITFNRFGAFNPAGMIYALRQDVVYDDPSTPVEENLPLPEAAKLDDPVFAKSIAGRVSLRSNKRPRPLVLRVNEGNCLQVKFWNLLAPLPENHSTFVRADFPRENNFEPGKDHYAGGGVQRHSVQVTEPGDSKATDISTPPRDAKLPNSFPFPREEEPDYPTTRAASIHVNGLDYVPIRPQICRALDKNSSDPAVSEQDKAALNASCKGAGKGMGSDGANVGNNPSSLVEPGQHTKYVWFARQEGGYFMYSAGALAGGEGDGGQLGLGLFGSINVEPKGSVWYRSQVTHDELTDAAGGGNDYSHIDYVKLAIVKNGVIQHSDLNAVIYQTDKTSETPEVCSLRSPGSSCGMSFREFTTIFHDENKVFQAFAELSDENNPISRLADGMAVNYGASGVGSAVLANLKKIGPGKDCPECKLEEFFLSSWVNGDPAMIVRRDQEGRGVEALYADDPSNVHHSYLGDPVRFRNIHAGPKETHVFHLHAHQWLQDKNDPNANYLDSQTISPGSSYTYDIQYGGGGNRNLTVGDAIFHCHLYPHFAAGMWELWRNHDVFEDGKPGYFDPRKPVSASNDPRMRNLPDNELKQNGSPNPAVVPIPGFALAPLPTADLRGYPFFIAGEAGHRPPQPPMDMAINDKANGDDDKWLDGGLPRHIVVEGSNRKIRLDDPNDVKDLIESHGDKSENKAARYVANRVWKLNSDPNNLGLAKEMQSATLRIMPQCGTKDEILAMAFHAGWNKQTILGLKDGQQPANMPQSLWQACQDEFKQTLAELSDDSLQWTLTSQPTQWPVKRLIHSEPGNVNSPLAPMNALWNGLGYQSLKEAEPADQTANPAFDPGDHFRVNGLTPAQGAPMADPCPSQYFDKPTGSSFVEVNRLYPRLYKSAYIQFDMTVNKYGWHDPQARMPVLEQDAAKTMDGIRLAEPLFFRANSGDCIQFQATNLIPSILNLDDFQVYTPTDTIGQHIHLVKFDVTSSDGSANGWNYEDGTFSPDEVRERIEASHRGKVVDINDQPLAALAAKTHPMFRRGGSMESKAALGTCTSGGEQKDHPWCGAQTTVQRWWADPVLNDKWDDRTMRAVFTHDHYGPSSHQQHGFYAALVVEPKDSVWTKLDSAPDSIDSQQVCNDQTIGGALKSAACRSDGGPTSYAANIGYPKDYPEEQLKSNKDKVRREYNLAFADFAILYNADLRPVNPPSRQVDLMLPHVVRDGLKPKPEGISAEDPGTRLLNYRNEPIPLRVGQEDSDSLEYRQKADTQGDMANVFSSVTHRNSTADAGSGQSWKQTAEQHAMQRLTKLLANVPNEIGNQGELKAILKNTEERRRQFVKNLYIQEPWRDAKGGDPSTPVLAAYEGDPVQLHLIQGAQEEQHVFSMQGMKWLSEPHSPNSGYMNGQQLGISEHFEFDTLVSVARSPKSDYWLGSPAVENLWDGMWGILRAHGPKASSATEPVFDDFDGLARLPGSVVSKPPRMFGKTDRLTCPSGDDTPKKEFYVTAWRVSQIKNLFYNNRPAFAIEDPNAIAFFEIPKSVVMDAGESEATWNHGQKILDYLKQKYVNENQPIEPLVLRANAGDCVDLQFMNYLPKVVEIMDGKHVAARNESYNLMPPIVNGFNFNQLQMSSRIGLVPQLVAENIPLSQGANVGINPRQEFSALAEGCQIAGDEPFSECDKNNRGVVSRYRWYMGDQKVLSKAAKDLTPCQVSCIDQAIRDATKPEDEQITGYIRYTPMEFGAVSIRSFGDVIKHSSHGLVGALIVEPPGATYSSSVNTVADISTPSGGKFKEFVLVVQDDLSLRQHHQPMPNHRMADDAEDTGQKGFNYRTEPLWARNGLGTSGADFNVLNAVDYRNTLSSIHANPGCQGPCGDPQTPVFSATAGEPVRFRIVHPGGHSRQHAFVLHGHNWDYQPWANASTQLFERNDSTPESDKPKTMRLGAIGGIGPARHVNILTRAGGEFATPGDYLFRVQEQFQFQGGMWGIFRVTPK